MNQLTEMAAAILIPKVFQMMAHFWTFTQMPTIKDDAPWSMKGLKVLSSTTILCHLPQQVQQNQNRTNLLSNLNNYFASQATFWEFRRFFFQPMLDQSLALAKFKFLLFVPTSEEVLRQNITCLKLKLCCFKKIKEKLNLEIWTVNFRSPCFGINDGYKTKLYSVPFPDLWKGFFCVCLIRPIFLNKFCQSRNWSMLLSDLMASSILELAVGWTSSVGCTQNVVNLYTSCQGPSP